MSRSAVFIGLGLLLGALLPLDAVGADNPASVPSVIVPLDPQRILDTRSAVGISTTTPLVADQTITLQVAGAGGVPVGATGVVLNVTVNGAAGAGYVTAYPSGGSRPTASVINYTDGEDVANMITATLNGTGAIDLYNAQSSAHLIADVAGYLIPGTSGTPGPQGPQGLQGPAGEAAPRGLEIDMSLRRSPSGLAPQIELGAIGGAVFYGRCHNTPNTPTLMISTHDDPILLVATIVDDDGVDPVYFQGIGGPGNLLFPTDSFMHITGTLSLPRGGKAQVDLAFGPSPYDPMICEANGTILPV